jgi:hypothetical protein
VKGKALFFSSRSKLRFKLTKKVDDLVCGRAPRASGRAIHCKSGRVHANRTSGFTFRLAE